MIALPAHQDNGLIIAPHVVILGAGASIAMTLLNSENVLQCNMRKKYVIKNRNYWEINFNIKKLNPYMKERCWIKN